MSICWIAFFLFIGSVILSRVAPLFYWKAVYLPLKKLYELITFPGIVTRELSHKIACDLACVPVYEAKYFSLGSPAGYVMHGEPASYRAEYVTTVVPFVLNSALAIAMFIPLCLNLNIVLDAVFLWLGCSFALHAMPDGADSQRLWKKSAEALEKNPLVVIAFPPAIAIMITNSARNFLRVNLIYAAVLFCITFCALAAVLLAGSAVLPGVYSVQIAGAESINFTSTHHETPIEKLTRNLANASPKTATASKYALTPGKEASASDWLPIADAAMAKEDSDAVLIYIHGYSSDRGIALPVNGKAHEWWYQYAVPGEDTVYDVRVKDGELESLKQGTRKNGNVPIGNWTMDSVDAVTVASARYREVTGSDPLSCAYVLEGSYVPSVRGKPTWTVCYYDSTSRVVANIQVNLETAQVVYTWMPPST